MNDRCDWVRARLERLIDRELPDDETAAVEEHCATCAGCRAALASLRAADRAVGATAENPPAEDETFRRRWARFQGGFDLAALDRQRTAEIESGVGAQSPMTGEEVAAAPLEVSGAVPRETRAGAPVMAAEAARASLAARARAALAGWFAPRPAWRWASVAGGAVVVAVITTALIVRHPEVRHAAPVTGHPPMIAAPAQRQEPPVLGGAGGAESRDRRAEVETRSKVADVEFESADLGAGGAPEPGEVVARTALEPDDAVADLAPEPAATARSVRLQTTAAKSAEEMTTAPTPEQLQERIADRPYERGPDQLRAQAPGRPAVEPAAEPAPGSAPGLAPGTAPERAPEPTPQPGPEASPQPGPEASPDPTPESDRETALETTPMLTLNATPSETPSPTSDQTWGALRRLHPVPPAARSASEDKKAAASQYRVSAEAEPPSRTEALTRLSELARELNVSGPADLERASAAAVADLLVATERALVEQSPRSQKRDRFATPATPLKAGADAGERGASAGADRLASGWVAAGDGWFSLLPEQPGAEVRRRRPASRGEEPAATDSLAVRALRAYEQAVALAREARLDERTIPAYVSRRIEVLRGWSGEAAPPAPAAPARLRER